MSSQDDKASYFGKGNTKRGNKVSFVKNPNPSPKKYSAGAKISRAGNTGSSNAYPMNRNTAKP
jgi:hypothetical protein